MENVLLKERSPWGLETEIQYQHVNFDWTKT